MFDRWERDLEAAIKKTRAPFLGLLGGLVPAAARIAVEADVKAAPGAWDYAQRLEQYPALFAVRLAEHVMHGLGQRGYYEVYPYVQQAIGTAAPLTLADRERLHRSFRRALLKLGLELSPRSSNGGNRITREFVRQAGVPIAFADDLSERMLRHARRVGLPDEDDHEGLLAWQASLDTVLQLSFSVTARDAVARDTQAYYAHTFARLANSGGTPESGNAVEEAFAKAFSTSTGSVALRRQAPPQLLYRDGILGLLLPAGLAGQYRVRWGSESILVRGTDEGTFHPLPLNIAPEIVAEDASGQVVLRRRVWTDGLNNRLLFFNEAGRLVAEAQLSAEGVEAHDIELPPGRYVALCRFEPDEAETAELISEQPKLVEVPVDLRPGAHVCLRRGAATVDFVGQESPAVRLEGPSKTSTERLEVFWGQLTAHVDLPSEFEASGQLELRVRAHGTVTVRVPINDPAAEGGLVVPLAPAIEQLAVPPGLVRLHVEVGRVGEVRSLHRQTAWYWRGLQHVSSVLDIRWLQPPANLRTNLCRGLSIDDAGARPTDALQRVARLAFETAPGRVTNISWNRPGVFVEVETPAPDGSVSRVGRRLGDTESVSSIQRKSIVISGSGSGMLRLGSWSLWVDFDRTPTKTLGAGFLAGKLEPAARALEFLSSGTSVPQTLLQLCRPHVVDSFAAKSSEGAFEITMTVRGDVRTLVLHAADIRGSNVKEQQCAAAPGVTQHGAIGTAQLSVISDEGKSELTCLLDPSTVLPGAWHLTFEADVDGVRGRLEDVHQGRIGTCLVIDAKQKEVPTASILGSSLVMDGEEKAVTLRQLATYFQSFWSPLCTERLAPLGPFWQEVLDAVGENVAHHVPTLVDLCCLEPDPDGRLGWLPRQHAGGQLPTTFALPRIEYRKVNTRTDCLARSLRAMGDIKASLAEAFGSVLAPPVAGAFDNFAGIVRGQWPRGFSLQRYCEVLRSTPVEDVYRLEDGSAEVGHGDYLGTLHVSLAWRDAERRLVLHTMSQSNRSVAALSLATMLAQRQQTIPHTPATPAAGQSPLVKIGAPSLDGLNDEQCQFQENLRKIAHACSLLAWHCRLASRQSGALPRFQAQLQGYLVAAGMQESVSGCLSYYLQTAPALFGYYLLLWEIVQATSLDPQVVHV